MAEPGLRGATAPPETSGVIPRTRSAKTIDGAYIAYQDFGEGPVTLVVIHGWISHLEVYWEQPLFARLMRRLAERTRVLQFDKRGIGMSDRLTRAPELEAQMDDVRAVMDTASVERAALFAWGWGGSPLAVFFAAAHPERTVALCIDPTIQMRWTPDFPFGMKEEEFERDLAELMTTWSDDIARGYEHAPGGEEFARWDARLGRFAGTPWSFEVFQRMWFETDVRDILPAVRVPTLVVCRTGSPSAGPEPAAYVAEQIVPLVDEEAFPGCAETPDCIARLPQRECGQSVWQRSSQPELAPPTPCARSTACPIRQTEAL